MNDVDRKTKNLIITHKGMEIALHDYRNIDEDDFVPAIEANVQNSIKMGNPNQLLLLDITNVYISTAVLDTFKKASVDIKPYMRKLAVIGVKGIQKVFLKFILTFSKSNNIKSFNTKEDALDWLILP